MFLQNLRYVQWTVYTGADVGVMWSKRSEQTGEHHRTRTGDHYPTTCPNSDLNPDRRGYKRVRYPLRYPGPLKQIISAFLIRNCHLSFFFKKRSVSFRSIRIWLFVYLICYLIALTALVGSNSRLIATTLIQYRYAAKPWKV